MAARRVPREERMFEVYRFNQRSGTDPYQLINAISASYLLDCKFATRVGRWRIRLAKPTPLKLRDQSANIRESTILAAISGSHHHRSLIEAWA